MIQQIITLVIVFAATGVALSKLVKSILPSQEKCAPCQSSCGGCPVHELKEEIAKKQASQAKIIR